MIQKKVIISLLLLNTCFIVAQQSLSSEPSKEIINSDALQDKVVKAPSELPKKSKKTSKKTEPSSQPLHDSVATTPSDKGVNKIECIVKPAVEINRIRYRISTKSLEKGAKDILVTDRMLASRSLDGQLKTPEELFFELALYDSLQHDFRMPPLTQDAEQHIENLKNQHHLKQQDIERIFRDAGLTYEEGFQELVRFYTIRAFMSQWMASKVIVTEAQIQKYYESHPEIVPTSYKIEKAFINKKDVSQQAIDTLNKYGIGQDNLIWQPAYWIAEDELADSKKFITTMLEGVVTAIDAGDQWEVVRLVKKVEKHEKPLVSRRKEIAEKLQYEQYEEKMEELKKMIMSQHDIIEVK